jgi:hypothetical protein
MKFVISSECTDSSLERIDDFLWLDSSFVEITSGTWQSGYVLDRQWRSGNYITITKNGNHTYHIETSYFKDSYIVHKLHPGSINNIGLGVGLALSETDIEFYADTGQFRADSPVNELLAQAWFSTKDRIDLVEASEQIYQRLTANLIQCDLPQPVNVAYTFGLDSGVTAAIAVEQCIGPRLVIDNSFRDLARLLPWPYHDIDHGELHTVDGVEVQDFFDYPSLLVSHWGDHVLLRKPDMLPNPIDSIFFWKQVEELLVGRRYHNQSYLTRHDIYRDPKLTAVVLSLKLDDLRTQIQDSYIQKHILRQRFPKWWSYTFKTKNQRSSMVPHSLQKPDSVSHVDTIDLFTASIYNSVDRY